MVKEQEAHQEELVAVVEVLVNLAVMHQVQANLEMVEMELLHLLIQQWENQELHQQIQVPHHIHILQVVVEAMEIKHLTLATLLVEEVV